MAAGTFFIYAPSKVALRPWPDPLPAFTKRRTGFKENRQPLKGTYSPH